MRDGDWKLLARLRSSEGKPLKARVINKSNQGTFSKALLTDLELYKISTDIGEKDDLAKKHPEKVRAMAKKLEKIYRDVTSEAKAW